MADYRPCHSLSDGGSHPGTVTSALRFAATEAVRPDPAGDNLKPGANLGSLGAAEQTGTPDAGALPRRGEEEFTGGADEVTDLGEKEQKYLSYIRKSERFSLFYPICCKSHRSPR